MTSKNRQLILALALVLVLIAFAYYRLLWSPLSARLDTAVATTQQLEAALLEARTAEKSLNRLEEQRQARRQAYEEMLVKIPVSPGLPELIDLVGRTASDNGCQLKSIAYSERGTSSSPAAAQGQSSAPAVKSVTMSVTVNGGYYDIKSFLMALEEAPRLLSLSNINLSRAETAPPSPEALGAGGQGNGQVSQPADELSLTLDVTAYYDERVPAGLESGWPDQVKPTDKVRENPFQ